jgi:hypothetical protein
LGEVAKPEGVDHPIAWAGIWGGWQKGG